MQIFVQVIYCTELHREKIVWNISIVDYIQNVVLGKPFKHYKHLIPFKLFNPPSV